MILRILFVVAGFTSLGVGLVACAGPQVLNSLTSRSGYTVERSVRYAPGDRGTYDLYVPDNAGPTTPMVVFVYGGSWDSGSKDIYLFLGQSLASEGIIVAVPDYRLYPEVLFPAFVEDAANAVAVVEAAARTGTSGLPAGRHPLFMMGHSAGAEIAALVALDERYLGEAGLSTRRLAGFIGLAGPYDFLPLTEERYKRIFPPAVRAASQPVNFVDGSEPPMLLIAGSADRTVNPENTLSLARKVRASGGRVTDEIVPGVDHIGAVSALATALPLSDRTIRGKVIAFIKDHS